MRVRTARVPTGYRELEYIESSGTQYINTNYNLTTTTCAEVDVYFNPSSNNDKRFISYEFSGKYMFDIYYESSALRFRVGYPIGLTTYTLTKAQRVVARLEVANNKRSSYVNGTLVEGDKNVNGQDTLPSNAKMFLFARNAGSVAQSFGVCKMYSCKIWDTNGSARSFIPVERQSDGKPGLYDTINQQFYTNSGTGEFIKGPYKDSYKTPILIEEGTTNLGGTSTTYSNFTYNAEYRLEHWGGADGHCWYYKSGGYENFPYVKYTSTSIGSGGIYKDTTDNLVLTAGKTYAMSCYIKADQAVVLNEYGFSLNRHSDNRYETFGTYLALTTEWKRFSKVFTVTSAQSGNYCVRNITYQGVPVGVSVYWSAFQLEEKDHATPFTLTTRPNNYAQLSTPKILYPEGTTNIALYNNIWGWSNSGACSYNQNDKSISNIPYPNYKVVSITQTTAGQSAGYFGTTNIQVPSKTLTATVWFYMSGTHTGTSNIGPYIRSNKTAGSVSQLKYNGSTNFRNWPNNQWIKLQTTFTTNSTETTVYFCAYTANLNEKFAFNAWQIEEKDHATLYVNGTRPNNSII